MIAAEISIAERFRQVRKCTEDICSPLKVEDYVVQPIEDVSPPKWHLGHTTWFFETFILQATVEGYRVYNEKYSFLFNSYYESAGAKIIRTDRGNITRPTVEEIMSYRRYVDGHLLELLDRGGFSEAVSGLLEIGLQHEQQHQELLLYDIKYILGNNPLFPVYIKKDKPEPVSPGKGEFIAVAEGVYEIGFNDSGFCFDNELGLHKVFLQNYGIMNRLITNGEYLEFMLDGGYRQFSYWLSEGWEWVKAHEIKAPQYWHFIDGQWYQYSLNGGLRELEPAEPVTHVSFYEADAFAKWQGVRLPTEFEWEVACRQHSGIHKYCNFMEEQNYEPVISLNNNDQMFGDVWEWTNSAYLPYPYYKIPDGAVGEYNGKFMINQMVLRGGSCATPRDHIRATYRNFFHPHLRWMFSGIRLAQNL